MSTGINLTPELLRLLTFISQNPGVKSKDIPIDLLGRHGQKASMYNTRTLEEMRLIVWTGTGVGGEGSWSVTEMGPKVLVENADIHITPACLKLLAYIHAFPGVRRKHIPTELTDVVDGLGNVDPDSALALLENLRDGLVHVDRLSANKSLWGYYVSASGRKVLAEHGEVKLTIDVQVPAAPECVLLDPEQVKIYPMAELVTERTGRPSPRVKLWEDIISIANRIDGSMPGGVLASDAHALATALLNFNAAIMCGSAKLPASWAPVSVHLAGYEKK